MCIQGGAMTKTVRDVMSPTPIQLDANSTITQAAQAMRDNNIGTIIVTENGSAIGITTDRDIVVRSTANGDNPSDTPLRQACSMDLTTVSPDTSLDQAVSILREKALRRLPVMQNNNIVGIVSIGDFAIELDSRSALADISAAVPNT
jgi:CBS domain-containing protein